MEPVLNARTMSRIGQALTDARVGLAALLRRAGKGRMADDMMWPNISTQPAAVARQVEAAAKDVEVDGEIRTAAESFVEALDLARAGDVERAEYVVTRVASRLHAYRAAVVMLAWVDPRTEEVRFGRIIGLADFLAELESEGGVLRHVHEMRHGRIVEVGMSIMRDGATGASTVTVDSGLGAVCSVYHPAGRQRG